MKPNDLVGGYQFVQPLGEGPSGAVWLAREKDSALLVSIKLLKTDVFPPSSAQVIYERLVSTVTEVGRLTHPNLAQVRTTFHYPRYGLFGLVSEYLDGRGLDGIYIPKTADGRPGAKDPRTLAGVLAWFQQLATVLAWLHANRVIHGGVKPRNVMLMTGFERPTIKLLDLCWSRAGIEVADDERFIPPELATSRPTALSDQWGAAKLLHNLLITSAPGSTAEALQSAPVALLKVVQRALHKDPRQRFPDTGAFFYALEAVRHQLEQSAAYEPPESPTLPTEPMHFAPGPPVPRIEVRPAASLSRERERVVRQALPPADENLKDVLQIEPHDANEAAIDEFFHESSPPLIAPPPPSPEVKRRTANYAAMDREIGDTFEPDAEVAAAAGVGRSWVSLAGIAALAAVIVFILGGIYFLTRPTQAPLKEPSRPVPPVAQAKPDAAIAPLIAAKTATAVALAPAARPDASTAAPTAAVASAAPDAAVAATASPPARPDAAVAATASSPARPDAALAATASPPRPDAAAIAAPSAPGRPDAAVAVAAGPPPKAPLALTGTAELERACERGQLSACVKAGDLLVREGNADAGRRARRAYERACDNQNGIACELLAKLYSEGVGGPANERTAKAFRARACAFGRKESCR